MELANKQLETFLKEKGVLEDFLKRMVDDNFSHLGYKKDLQISQAFFWPPSEREYWSSLDEEFRDICR